MQYGPIPKYVKQQSQRRMLNNRVSDVSTNRGENESSAAGSSSIQPNNLVKQIDECEVHALSNFMHHRLTRANTGHAVLRSTPKPPEIIRRNGPTERPTDGQTLVFDCLKELENQVLTTHGILIAHFLLFSEKRKKIQKLVKDFHSHQLT